MNTFNAFNGPSQGAGAQFTHPAVSPNPFNASATKQKVPGAPRTAPVALPSLDDDEQPTISLSPTLATPSHDTQGVMPLVWRDVTTDPGTAIATSGGANWGEEPATNPPTGRLVLHLPSGQTIRVLPPGQRLVVVNRDVLRVVHEWYTASELELDGLPRPLSGLAGLEFLSPSLSVFLGAGSTAPQGGPGVVTQEGAGWPAAGGVGAVGGGGASVEWAGMVANTDGSFTLLLD